MTLPKIQQSEPIKVLHVDDDQDNLILSKLILEEINSEINIDTTDSTETVEKNYHQYDCILSDYDMPIKTGIQLAESIREKSDIPFILYTGKGSEEVAEAAFQVGIDDYIRKETESAHYQVVAKRIQMAVERHTAQKKLERSQASLAKAQEIAHMGNWDWFIVDNELYWSDEIYRIFGLKPQEFGATYEAFLNSVYPDDREHVTSSVNQALDNKKTYSIDHRIILPDGEVRVVHEQAQVFFNEGAAVRMIGTVQDITSQKLLEKRLRVSEENYRDIAENSFDAIFTLDLRGNITYVSPAIERILGLSVDDVVGRSFQIFMPKQGHLKAQHQFTGLLFSEPVEDIEFDFVRVDGFVCSIEIKAVPVFKDGKVVKVQGFLRDVTERKRLRDEVKRLNDVFSIHNITDVNTLTDTINIQL